MDKNRITELAQRALKSGRYMYTDFMGQGDLASFLDYADKLGVPYSIFGGYPEAERGIVIFGDEELCGYAEIPPVKALMIKARGTKFAEALTHRDYLGALMNLGITREMLGDIVIDQGGDKASKAGAAYVFVAEHMADYIVDSLMNIKHTAVDVSVVEELPEGLGATKEEKQLVVSSNRLDAIIARVFGMSREAAAELISDGRIFINGRTVTKKEKSLSEGDRVSVRGFGKFVFSLENGKTKKDRLMITVEIYR
ncbi:MAG: hypothetical protein IJ703_08755 [Eubacterium sp.]|nr:hypothetical protein [Eubacterium sp.]